MSDNIFQASARKGLYILEGATGWIAYILTPGYNDLPKTITLEDSLEKYPGSYLFGASAPGFLDDNFIKAFWTYLNAHDTKAQQSAKRCFFWINPEYGKGSTTPGKAILFEKFKCWGTSENLKQASRSQQLDINASIFMGIPPFCKIEIHENKLTISRMPTSIFSNATYGLFLHNTKRNVSMRLGNIDSRGVGIETPMTIPLTGTNRGCLKFDLSFPFTFKDPAYFECDNDYYPYKSNEKQDEYTILDTGFKYFYPDGKNKDRELFYEIFHQGTPAGFTASIDFSDIFNARNPRRSFFAFTGKDVTKEKTDTILKTTFITNYGKQITLKPVTTTDTLGNPQAGSALIVFSQGILSPTAQKRYYWTLEGDFELGTISAEAGTAIRQMLLCGISGTETISFQERSEIHMGDRITFFPGQPAYAKSFVNNKHKTGTGEALLTDKYTTAWTLIRKGSTNQGSTNNYYSQPVQAPLFEPGKNQGTLNYAEVPSADLSLLDPQQKESFPMAPSATVLPALKTSMPGINANDTPDDIKRFETEVLNPVRKQWISTYQKANQKPGKRRLKAKAASLKTTDDCPAGNLTTTPQGFLVNLNADKTAWKCMTLANNEPKGTEQYQLPLRFKNIDTLNDRTGLQSAFQTNEQFLVISDPAKPGDPEVLQYYIDNFQNQISIADWPFLLDIAHQHKESNTDAAFTNILVFKFCNRSIEERIKDPALWTDAAVFNQEKRIPELILWIENYIATARKAITNNETKNISESPQDKGFRQFINIVADPDWHGVLALQVTLNPESLPAEIKAIMAGIDPAGFAAHHLGIEANQIKTNEEQQLERNFKSSLFGMISYFNPLYRAYQSGTLSPPAPLPAVTGNYDFQVLDLQILFTNSLVSDFHATIQLSLNTIFDDPAYAAPTKKDPAIYSNSIVMKGQYDKKNGNISYTFSVIQPNTMLLYSTAIDEVTITGIELSTLEDTASVKDQVNNESPLLTTRFNLSGYLKFKKIGDFDLFSYETLLFSNLMLDMQFRLQDINPSDQTPRKKFTFIPGNISFDKGNSIPRPGSLALHFPIELQSLMYNDPNAGTEQAKPVTPESLGFMRVEAPLPTAPVNDYWYALRFNLNLGTVGALAAKVGFDAALILAWTPGKNNNQTHMYVKMPFSGGSSGSSFSIEGVLKFAIGSVLFFNDPVKKEYAMIFTEVGVSLLGKKLPPNGNTVLYLFGNPESPATDDSGSSNLAWFGAYKKEEASPKKLKTAT